MARIHSTGPFGTVSSFQHLFIYLFVKLEEIQSSWFGSWRGRGRSQTETSFTYHHKCQIDFQQYSSRFNLNYSKVIDTYLCFFSVREILKERETVRLSREKLWIRRLQTIQPDGLNLQEGEWLMSDWPSPLCHSYPPFVKPASFTNSLLFSLDIVLSVSIFLWSNHPPFPLHVFPLTHTCSCLLCYHFSHWKRLCYGRNVPGYNSYFMQNNKIVKQIKLLLKYLVVKLTAAYNCAKYSVKAGLTFGNYFSS